MVSERIELDDEGRIVFLGGVCKKKDLKENMNKVFSSINPYWGEKK